MIYIRFESDDYDDPISETIYVEIRFVDSGKTIIRLFEDVINLHDKIRIREQDRSVLILRNLLANMRTITDDELIKLHNKSREYSEILNRHLNSLNNIEYNTYYELRDKYNENLN